jgi:hypothetical protein
VCLTFDDTLGLLHVSTAEASFSSSQPPAHIKSNAVTGTVRLSASTLTSILTGEYSVTHAFQCYRALFVDRDNSLESPSLATQQVQLNQQVFDRHLGHIDAETFRQYLANYHANYTLRVNAISAFGCRDPLASIGHVGMVMQQQHQQLLVVPRQYQALATFATVNDLELQVCCTATHRTVLHRATSCTWLSRIGAIN